MLIKFQKHLDKNFSFLKEKKLFLAVSGGIDSIILVELLHKLNYKISVLHCNFSLRGSESDGDEEFVKSYCNTKKIPVFIQKFDAKQFALDYKLSIQVAARKLRYDWFYEQLNEQNFDFILTAHHLDDNLETFLINLTRGTGLEGLTGIPSQNDKIIRPLLPFSREEIENYAKENNIQWREDSSNASDKYLRNKIRHTIVPVLKEINTSFLDSFQKTQKHLIDAQSIVTDGEYIIFKEVVTEKEDGTVHFDLKKLLQLPNYSAYLYQWLKEFEFNAWQDIYDLVNAQSGKKVFSENYILLKDRDFLILYAKENEEENEEYFIEKNQLEVKIPLNISICNVPNVLETNSNAIFVDENKLQFPLTIRKWREADYFYPFGMIGKKKLSKFFKDEKLSLIDKSSIWLLCSNNEIVWIMNKRLDDRFKVTNATTNILKITIL
ncbi:tRNA lysidine(34) synthetase TilS [Flavobacterium sp.]|uniref:tRNA lysidine(34) synthetase TilS n=1 Tax=Flavobacterium sp. TaxID=239 RepID=UPI00374FFB36